MNTLVTPGPEIARDRYGRPLVTPPTGGKPVPYTRCTTYIDCLEDKYNLQKWMQRMVALGLASRPDLLLSVQAHKDDKRELDKITDAAKEAAASSAAATTGTALHALTELVDRGQDLPVLPANAKASIDAYQQTTGNLKATHIEQFLVLDPLQVGGTADRIVRDGTNLRIADIKTGSIEWGALKIAMQLAIYARSSIYDIATGERTISEVDNQVGIIIHLPSVQDPAEARCDLYEVDLQAGWYAVQVAKQVREKRKLKFGDLVRPHGTIAVPKPPKPEYDGVGRSLIDPDMTLAQRIKTCTDRDAVSALREAHQDVWTDELTAIATQHLASLRPAS